MSSLKFIWVVFIALLRCKVILIVSDNINFYKGNKQYLCEVSNLIQWTDRSVEWIPCGEDHGTTGHNAYGALDRMKNSQEYYHKCRKNINRKYVSFHC